MRVRESVRAGTLTIGDRCQFNERARESGLKGSRLQAGQRIKYAGFVVGESEDKTCWSVKWDGLRLPRRVRKVFVEAEA